TPLPPAEARTPPGPHHVPPDLLFHPVLHEGEAVARVADPEVAHPPPKDRVDGLDHPPERLGAVAPEDRLEFAEQRRAFLELRGRVGSPRAPQTPDTSDVEAQKPEALSFRPVDRSALLLVERHVELGQLLPQSSVDGLQEPGMTWMTVDQDHQ